MLNEKTVETVVKLVRKTPNVYIDITIDTDELDLTVFEEEATYKEIKDYIFEKHGVKVSSLYIVQIKQKQEIIEGEDYNVSKSEEAGATSKLVLDYELTRYVVEIEYCKIIYKNT